MKTNLKDERQETRSEKINHLKEMFFKKYSAKFLVV